MADITWAVAADFDKNGSYDTDLTGYVEMPGSGIDIDRGVAMDGTPLVSRISIALSNRDGTFTPDNSASSLYGRLEPDVPIQVTATHNAIGYTLWTGYIDTYDHSWSVGRIPMCRITCSDLAGKLGRLAPVNVTVAERTTSAALTAIATAAGLSGGDYSFATGAQTLPVHYVRNQDALSAFLDASLSEMGGTLYVDAAGVLTSLARTSRLGTTVDDTWGDGAIFPKAIGLRTTTDDLISKVSVQANIFAEGQADQIILNFSRGERTGDSLAIGAGETWEADLDYAGPAAAITTPVSTTDYTANTVADGSGTDRTSSLTVTVVDRGAGALVTLKNTHASDTIYVTKFQIRGQAYDFVSDRPRIEYEKSIPNQTIAQGIGVELPFADDVQATFDYATHLVHTYRYPYPVLSLTFEASSDAKKVAMLGVELWDLIRYKDTGLGASVNADGVAGAMVDDWFYVSGIRHRIPPNWGGKTFQSVITLVPSYLFRDVGKIVWDTFNRTNAVGDLGKSSSEDTWANDGNFDINSNGARANSDTLQVPDLDLGASATDQVVEVTLSAVGAGDEVGVTLRKTDASNYYNVYLDKGSNEVILEKNVATVVTEISSPAFTVGTDHELRTMIQGTRIRVWVDRRLYIDTTDSALSTGTKAGLFARNANATAVFNDFYGERL